MMDMKNIIKEYFHMAFALIEGQLNHWSYDAIPDFILPVDWDNEDIIGLLHLYPHCKEYKNLTLNYYNAETGTSVILYDGEHAIADISDYENW